jgi:2-polyprenyl-6-methoxyphenol hydroxylase-like FAD-dependent oxidoreductase
MIGSVVATMPSGSTARKHPGPVLVLGAGIGGLSAAIALRRAGWSVEVYERAPELREIGAGLTIQPNAILALHAIGLDRAVVAAGRRLPSGRLLRMDGRVLSYLPAEEIYARVGAPAVGIHRGTLQRVLLDALGPHGPHPDREAAAYEARADGVKLRFADGSEAVGALLVGADGLRSVVRKQLLADGAPEYAGYTAWRGIVPESAKMRVETSSESWGRGRRFGIVPIDGDRIYWYATLNIAAGASDASSAMLLDLFRGWHRPIEALIQATPPEAILRTDIFDRRPAARWSEGRVVLLGDAAHPMTPNLGQGACQAIEDAVVLAQCLDPLEPARGLSAYERRRRPRADAVVKAARRLGAIAQWQDPLACRLRDAVFAATPACLARRQLAAAWTFHA